MSFPWFDESSPCYQAVMYGWHCATCNANCWGSLTGFLLGFYQ